MGEDSLASAALLNNMSMDAVEFGIIVGVMETETKLRKLAKILQHRKKKQESQNISSIKGILEELKPLCNTITHGLYLGRTKEMELLYVMQSDFLIDDSQETVRELVAVTAEDLLVHSQN